MRPSEIFQLPREVQGLAFGRRREKRTRRGLQQVIDVIVLTVVFVSSFRGSGLSNEG